MSDDLITSLRALAAARHDDLSVAVDAVIEIERQRAEIERLRADLVIQQGCCDGAAAQDVRKEREEHRAEVEGLRAGIERLREQNMLLRDVVMQARRVLVPAFDRIHSLPRTSDIELARAIDIIIEKIRNALVRAASGGKP